jgi:hypothetical protein
MSPLISIGQLDLSLPGGRESYCTQYRPPEVGMEDARSAFNVQSAVNAALSSQLDLTIATPTHMMNPDAKNHPLNIVSASFRHFQNSAVFCIPRPCRQVLPEWTN